MFKSQIASSLAFIPWKYNLLVSVSRSRLLKTDESYHTFSPILTSFDESENFRAVIYPTLWGLTAGEIRPYSRNVIRSNDKHVS